MPGNPKLSLQYFYFQSILLGCVSIIPACYFAAFRLLSHSNYYFYIAQCPGSAVLDTVRRVFRARATVDSNTQTQVVAIPATEAVVPVVQGTVVLDTAGLGTAEAVGLGLALREVVAPKDLAVAHVRDRMHCNRVLWHRF